MKQQESFKTLNLIQKQKRITFDVSHYLDREFDKDLENQIVVEHSQ